MAKLRRIDAKAALAQQQADTRRGARGKAYIGDDAGASAGRAAEREKVRRLQEGQRERQRAARLDEPLGAILSALVGDVAHLTRTLVGLPFRVAMALRGHRQRGSEA